MLLNKLEMAEKFNMSIQMARILTDRFCAEVQITTHNKRKSGRCYRYMLDKQITENMIEYASLLETKAKRQCDKVKWGEAKKNLIKFKIREFVNV